MLLVGLVIGRWWAIPLGALILPVLVVLTTSVDAADLPLAAALGAANIAVGVVVRRALARLLYGITRASA
jgi:hypothetical protein